MLGFGLYCVLFLYPLRKRVKWLGKIGKARHWHDFHVLIGILAPILITLHASFKLAGVAGVSYWIMIAVALSGFVGRYIYAQIPRSLNAVELTMGELSSQVTELTAQLARQNLFQPGDLASLLRVPTPDEVRAMTLGQMLWAILRCDLARPILIARLRRRVLRGWRLITTLGGLLASNQADLEKILDRDPANLDARLELGRALYDSGDTDRALKETQRLLADHPGRVDGLYNPGAIYANLNRADLARQYWNQAVVSDPNSDSGKRAKDALVQLAK